MNTHCSPFALFLPLAAVFAAHVHAAAGACNAAYLGGGVVTSPNYPRNYANNSDCTYVLTAGAGRRVVLTFKDFKLENGYDFLTITSDGVAVGRYTGFTKPPVLTLGHSVTLRFTSDFSILAKGFYIEFSTIEANCGGLIVGSGLVRSPGFPSLNSAGLKCVWGVVATQGKTVTLDFQFFKLENNPRDIPPGGFNINSHFLKIYIGNTLLASYTGSTLPQRVNLGPAARLEFTSYVAVGNSGFSIVVASAVLTCGGLVSGRVTITSPNYPNNYPSNASCVWTHLNTADFVSLYFNNFNLEGNNYDTVKIYDRQTLSHTYSGKVLPPSSSGSSITVVFTSDRSVEYSGFNLTLVPGNWIIKK